MVTCYACDATAVGTRDRFYGSEGRVVTACERHAQSVPHRCLPIKGKLSKDMPFSNRIRRI